MAKESGLGWTTLSLDTSGGSAKDIRNDVTNFEFATPREVQEVTGVDKSAYERILLLADFSATLNGVFNDAADASHDVLKTVATSDATRTLSLAVSGQTLTVECLATDYAITRSDAGELTWEAPLVLANGVAPAWS